LYFTLVITYHAKKCILVGCDEEKQARGLIIKKESVNMNGVLRFFGQDH
jgi:hypothetical protein